jgi:O-antigen ligase
MFLIGIIYSTADWPDIFAALRKYDKYLFAVMFFPLFREEKWRSYAVNAFLASIFVSLIASYLKRLGWLWFWYGTDGLSVAVFKYSIEFNFLMVFGAYLCLFKITSARSYYRWLWIVFFALIAHTVLFRSIGRSGYLVFAGLMTLFFVQKLHWKGLVLAFVSVALLFCSAFIFSPTFKSRVEDTYVGIKSYNQNNEDPRITFVKNSLKLIEVHPIVGTGTGSFAKEYSEIKPTPVQLVRNPHNEYMHIMVQFGFVGLIILLLFFGVPWWYSRSLPAQEKYIAQGIIISIMLGSLANSWLLDVTEGHTYAYFIALAFGALPVFQHNPK